MRRTLAAVLLLVAPAAGRAEDIVIGLSAPFTGPSRALGREMYRGAMAWFSEVNQRGGIHGRTKVYFTTVEKGVYVPLADWGRWKK